MSKKIQFSGLKTTKMILKIENILSLNKTYLVTDKISTKK